MNIRTFFKNSSLTILAMLFLACENDDNKEEKGPFDDLVGTKITTNETWTSSREIGGKVWIVPGASLTISAGVTISFKYHDNDPDKVGAIITLKGDGTNASGKLIANGTATEPIVFTSARTTKSAGDWGGIILIGEAPTNINGEGAVEGLPNAISYGGLKNSDDSGSLKYVRIEYCGFGLSAGNEINGLSFYGVGGATVIDHIQVYKCTDDGYEWFGGSVDAKYLISSFNDDDSFDMDEGWQGRGQFWLAAQSAGGDNGFESDGRKKLRQGAATNPTLYNVTLVGFGTGKDAEDKSYGMRLREDFEGVLRNFVITNFAGISWKLESGDIDGVTDLTSDNFGSKLTIKSVAVYNNSLDDNSKPAMFNSSSDSTRFFEASNNVLIENPSFINKATGDFRTQFTQVAKAPTAVTPPNDGFFDVNGNFVGAVDPNATSAWTSASWVRWND
jgi:hypothetical protein